MISAGPNRKYYVLCHGGILVYSFTAVFMKLAAGYDMFSLSWFVYYAIALLMLMIYAVIWQIVLKHLPLVIAFSNKVVALAWQTLYAVLIFGERISIKQIVALLIVITGILLVVRGGNEQADA